MLCSSACRQATYVLPYVHQPVGMCISFLLVYHLRFYVDSRLVHSLFMIIHLSIAVNFRKSTF